MRLKLLLITIALFVGFGSYGQSPTNGGFENGTVGWTTTGATSTINARTGINSLLSASSTSTTNTAHTNSAIIVIPNNNYAHVIGWAIGLNSFSNASVGGTLNVTAASATTANIGTTLTRLTPWNIQNTSGSSQNFTSRVSSRTSTTGNATQVYFDDVIMYTDGIATADLIKPVTASLFTNGTIASSSAGFSWTNGSDANTGIQNTIILRTTNLSAATPVMNDQGVYSTAGGTSGPNTVTIDWTVISTTVGSAATTYTDATVVAGTTYKYAVIHRDLAYNYSAALVSGNIVVPASGPTITLAQFTTGIALSPLLASSTDKAVLGFSATATSAANMTAINVGTSTTSVNKFTNIKLYSSTDNDYTTTGDNTQITGFTFAQTATQLQFSGFTETLSTSAKYYFIVADIDASVTAATLAVQPSITNANVTVSTGTVTGGTITGTNYSFDVAAGTPTAALTGTLTETNLNNATFTITLTNDAFSSYITGPPIPLDITNFSLATAPLGTSISSVIATSSTTANVALVFDGTDFDSNYTPTVTINSGELVTSTSDLTSGTITITAISETITGATTTAAFTTTYGTASAAQTFAVSGSNLRANLVATAPTGFEVSSDGGTTYGTTASFSASAANAGGVSFKIRLAATAAIGTIIYNSQNIVLSSTEAPSINIATPVSGNFVNPNASSDVAYNNGSSTSDNTNILYANYQGTTLSSTATSGANACVGVMGLYLRDGGSTGVDADVLGTELTAITFMVTNAANIRFARLFDGNTPLGTPTAVTGGNTLAFTGISIIAPDGGPQKSFNLRLTFNAAVTDNDKMVFTVSSVTANPAGSTFAAANGGGAYSDNASGDINRIEVTADRLAFAQQPTNNSIGTNLSPSPTVSANDSLGNRDKDVTTGTITITSTGTLSATQTATPTAGLATFASMAFTDAGTWQLTATYTLGTSALTFVLSNTFVISPVIYIHGDYRSTGSGTWLGALPTASWEKYSTITGLWTAVSEPANNYATGGASLYIGAGTTITTGNAFGGVAIKVLSGGTFTCTYNSTATSLYIFDGGSFI